MSLNGVSTYQAVEVGRSPPSRPQGDAAKPVRDSAMPYVSPVLRVDIGRGDPVMAYRDRQTGEVTEERSARLESSDDPGQGGLESRRDARPADSGKDEAPSAERAEAAKNAYQQTANNSAKAAEPARPASLSFEA